VPPEPGRANRRRALFLAVAVGLELLLVAGELLTGGRVWLFSWATELAVAGAILLTAWSVGCRLAAVVWPRVLTTRLSLYVAFGLGLGSIAAFVFVLAGAGWLSRPALTLALVVGAIAGIKDVWPVARGWLRSPSPDRRYGVVETIILFLPMAAGMLYATLPPTFYDALVYHLGLPNLYLSSGSLIFPESFSLAGYPQNAEMILTLALAAGGEVAVRITSFLISVLAAWTIRRIVADRYGRTAGNLAYLLLVSQWFFWFQAIFLKVDMIGAFLLLAGIAAVLEGTEDDGVRPWIVGGVLAGLSLGVKFSNLVPVGLAAVSLPWILGTTAQRRWKRGLLLLVLALGVSSPWLIRNGLNRANPFFPAFYDQLGGTGWDADNAARMRAETGMNLERTPMAAAKRLAMIGWRSGYGSGGELSRAWLPLLLAGLLLSRRREVTWLLGLSAVGLAVGVVFFTSYLRVYAFSLLIVPVSAAVLWDRFHHRIARAILALVFVAIVIPGFLFSFNLSELISAGGRRVYLGSLSPEDYLIERLSYTPIARYIDETLDPSAKIRIIGSARSAYIHRECAMTYVWDDPWIADLIDDPGAPQRLTAELRDEGFTHVLLDTGEMDRLERAQGLYGYSSREGGRGGIDEFLRGLTMEVEANGVYLFRVPSGSGVPEPPAVQRNARIDSRSRTNRDSPWTAR
jgi:hypothetical protein